MTARRTPRTPAAGDRGGPDPDKKNMTVQPDAALRARVEEIAQKTRNSWGATALNLIELGLAAQAGAGDPGALRLTDLPPWLAAALQEVGKLNGQDLRAVILDVLLKNVRTELEAARAQERQMSGLLKRPAGPGQ